LFQLKSLSKMQKIFFLTFGLGFMIKYNYLLTQIFRAPSWLGGILRNIFLLLLLAYFILPLSKTRKGQKRLIIFSGVFTFIFMANLWYNRYFGNYLGFTDIIVSESIGSPLVVLRHIMNLWDPVFVLDLLIMGYIYPALPRTISPDKGAQQKGQSIGKDRKTRVLVGIILILLLTTQILATNMLMGNERPLDLYERSTGAFTSVYGIIPLYFFEAYHAQFHLNDLDDKPEIPPEISAETLDGEEKIADKDNIIVIQVESLDEKMLGHEYNDREITPFLNDLKEKSLYGENFFTKHVNGSFDADFSLLTSLYPINRTYAFKQNDMSQFATLPRVLQEKGYHTMAFHGNEAEFFHRHQAYPDMGFDEFYSREDFSLEDREMDMEEGYLGINDYDFFKQSLDYLEQGEEPFFAYFITVTSHTPFDFYPEEMMVDEYKDIDDKLLHDFFQSISFVDSAMEMFFAELEERGLKDDTLFVIYSDHDASIDTNEYSSILEFELERNVKKPEHIPLLIKHPEIEAGIIEEKGTITDLAPTILDILGAEDIPEEFLGRTLLAGEEEPVYFLHEFPQIFYREQLFLKELDEITRVGHVKNRENTEVSLSSEQKEKAQLTINFMRAKMQSTLRE